MNKQFNLSQHSKCQITSDINAPSIPIDARPVQMSGRNRDCTNDEGFWCAADAVAALLGGVRARWFVAPVAPGTAPDRHSSREGVSF